MQEPVLRDEMKKIRYVLILLLVLLLFILIPIEVNGKEEYKSIEMKHDKLYYGTSFINCNYETIINAKGEELIEKQNEITKKYKDKKEWFIEYKKLIDDYSKWFDPPETIYDYYSKNEIYLMQRCVETETYQADFTSKCHVASVILNRLSDEKFPNSIYEIIKPGQFAFGRKNISEDTRLALEYAFSIADTTSGALYFHSNQYTSYFNGAKYIFTDKINHHFYK